MLRADDCVYSLADLHLNARLDIQIEPPYLINNRKGSETAPTLAPGARGGTKFRNTMTLTVSNSMPSCCGCCCCCCSPTRVSG